MTTFSVGDSVRITRDIYRRHNVRRGEVCVAQAGDVGEVVETICVGGIVEEYAIMMTGRVSEWIVYAWADWVEAAE